MSIYSVEVKDKNKKLEYYETVFPRLNEFYENNYKTVKTNKVKANKYDSLVEKIKERFNFYDKKVQDIRENNIKHNNATKYDYLNVGKRDAFQELLDTEK